MNEQVSLDNECGIIIHFSQEPAINIDTCTEAKVIVYRDKDGKTVALYIKCNEDENDFAISVTLSNEQNVESRTYNNALVTAYKNKDNKIIGLEIEYEWTRPDPC